MFLPLPNLDDRRWADLVEEARALIPLYAPQWTDHNLHDPGIMLLELFAWLTEMDIYQLNQIPERHQRKFLALLGLRPEPPRPAWTVLSFTSKASLCWLTGLECEGKDPYGQPVRFRLPQALTVVPAALQAVQIRSATGFYDLTPRWRQGEPLSPFGDDPQPGMELYLGFDWGPPIEELSLFCTVTDLYAGEQERCRLIAERNAENAVCHSSPALTGRNSDSPARTDIPPHHSVRLVWEFQPAPRHWQALQPARGELLDETRAFTLNGRIAVRLPAEMTKAQLGQVAENLYYLRCRFAAGAFEAAPSLLNLAVNAALAEQSATPESLKEQLTLADGTVLQVEDLGDGNGAPWQQVTVAAPPVLESSFRLFTLEGNEPRTWTLRRDFDASRRTDAHFLLDVSRGVVTFGDGEKGRVVPRGAGIRVAYLTTRAEGGNLAAKTIIRLVDADKDKSFSVTNAIPATGGAAAENLEAATGRAVALLANPNRAITLADYETLAKETPGVRLARVAARANVHPGLPSLRAPGVITVLILPYLPAARPMPSPALQRAVQAYLVRQRLIGTRVEVVGPTYLELAVRAKVQARAGTNATRVREQVAAALTRFFHPLHGGPDEQGWPFGRDVYRSEVLQVIDETEGVDHVLSLALLVGAEARCGNVCLGPAGLVAAGTHQIKVV